MVGVALATDLSVGDEVDAGPLHRPDRKLGRVVLRLRKQRRRDPPQLRSAHARHLAGERDSVDQPIRLRIAADDLGG